MHRIPTTLALLSLLCTPAALLAHGGHGTFSGHELAHYLTSPAHAIPVAAVLVLVVAYLIRRARRQAAGH